MSQYKMLSVASMHSSCVEWLFISDLDAVASKQ